MIKFKDSDRCYKEKWCITNTWGTTKAKATAAAAAAADDDDATCYCYCCCFNVIILMPNKKDGTHITQKQKRKKIDDQTIWILFLFPQFGSLHFFLFVFSFIIIINIITTKDEEDQPEKKNWNVIIKEKTEKKIIIKWHPTLLLAADFFLYRVEGIKWFTPKDTHIHIHIQSHIKK